METVTQQAAALIKEFSKTLVTQQHLISSLADLLENSTDLGHEQTVPTVAAAGKGKRKKKKAVDPDKPKRAKTAYNHFVEEYSKKVKEEHNVTTGKVVFGMCAAKWKEMNDAGKAPYNLMAEESKLAHGESIKAYELKKSGGVEAPLSAPKPTGAVGAPPGSPEGSVDESDAGGMTKEEKKRLKKARKEKKKSKKEKVKKSTEL